MQQMILGRTKIKVSRCGFGALPIQRVPMNEAIYILHKALDNGINFYDTARSYTDSEEKLGRAFAKRRREIILATKSGAADGATLLKQLEQSLRCLRTDYVDILQLHNPKDQLPQPGGKDGLYDALVEARDKGLTRFIGITNHCLPIAKEAVLSGWYDTVQFPLNSLSSPADLELIPLCAERGIGLIAMKALSGGLITNAAAAFAFLRQYDNVLPIWGIQREEELDEFLALEQNPPPLNDAMMAVIEKDRAELAGDFCRACGYCQPCPVGIPIPMAARMELLLHRMPYRQFLTDKWREDMEKIEDCLDCGQCRSRCPYGLEVPELLKRMLTAYRRFCAAIEG